MERAEILVVDDDPVVRRLIVTMLRAAGHVTDEAMGGREGAAKVGDRAYDVVVSDIDMPDGTGLDLLRAIRRSDLDLPVILVTGLPDVRTAAKAVEYGAFRYVTKPIDFAVLDAAARLGCLRELGRRIRDLSAAAIAHLGTGYSLFVNLHPEDLFDDDLLAAETALARVAPSVVLEITERASLPTAAGLRERLATLRTIGFRLAIDDIGAGYSGLSSFADVMPEIVKIDMSLVRGIDASEVRRRAVRHLCNLTHECGGLVVGEGVETAAERDCLRELGCDLFQGYLLGRPERELPR